MNTHSPTYTQACSSRIPAVLLLLSLLVTFATSQYCGGAVGEQSLFLRSQSGDSAYFALAVNATRVEEGRLPVVILLGEDSGVEAVEELVHNAAAANGYAIALNATQVLLQLGRGAGDKVAAQLADARPRLESQLRVEPLAGLPGPGVTTNLVNNVVAAIAGLFGSGRPVPVDGNYVLLGFGTDGAALALGAVLQQSVPASAALAQLLPPLPTPELAPATTPGLGGPFPDVEALIITPPGDAQLAWEEALFDDADAMVSFSSVSDLDSLVIEPASALWQDSWKDVTLFLTAAGTASTDASSPESVPFCDYPDSTGDDEVQDSSAPADDSSSPSSLDNVFRHPTLVMSFVAVGLWAVMP